MNAPAVEWAKYGLTLRVRHIAEIYDLKPDSIRKALRNGDPSVPHPFADRPYRFRKSNVMQHYERLELSDLRRARARLRRQLSEVA